MTMTRGVEALEDSARRLESVVAELRRLAEAEALRGRAARPLTEIGPAHVRALIAARRLWRACVPAADGDPAWLLLMELLALRLEGRTINVTALGETAGLPSTTSLRWIALLQREGLIARRPHPGKAHGVLLSLTDEGEDRLRAYLLEAVRVSPWVV